MDQIVPKRMKLSLKFIVFINHYIQESTFYKTSPTHIQDQFMNTKPVATCSPELQTICDDPITQSELLASLKATKNNKSPGIDGILGKVIHRMTNVG